METNFSNIKERILHFTDIKGFTKEKFFENLGVTYGNFKGKAKEKALSSDILAKIVTENPEINPEWLLTGKGEMLKEKGTAAPLQALPQAGGIPLVSVTAVGGFGNSRFAIESRDVKAWYVIPKFSGKRVDFMIEVEGSSMYPKYSPGDVVACTIIRESGFLQWNKTHVVATREQGLIIKRIRQGSSKDTLCMISDNKDYDPFEVPMSEITGIALVVGVIRLE